MMFRRVRLVVELGIFFLQMSRVRQQDAAQINRWRCGINWAVEALFNQPRNPAGVIEVRVRQDNRVNGICRHRQVLPVTLAPFFLPLKEAAVDQHLQASWAVAIDVYEMFRSGNDACCAKKLDIAQAVLTFTATDGCIPRTTGLASAEVLPTCYSPRTFRHERCPIASVVARHTHCCLYSPRERFHRSP